MKMVPRVSTLEDGSQDECFYKGVSQGDRFFKVVLQGQHFYKGGCQGWFSG
jgi:hypothetical protein